MDIIRTIKDEDLGFAVPFPEEHKQRSATRAVIFDPDGNIALLHARQLGYHTLPGGWIEVGEYIIEALTRETLEEIGCMVTNLREIGVVEEYRGEHALHQLSYCYYADIEGEKGAPRSAADDVETALEPMWVSLEEAVAKLEEDAKLVTDYTGKFMVARDLTVLKKAIDDQRKA